MEVPIYAYYISGVRALRRGRRLRGEGPKPLWGRRRGAEGDEAGVANGCYSLLVGHRLQKGFYAALKMPI